MKTPRTSQITMLKLDSVKCPQCGVEMARFEGPLVIMLGERQIARTATPMALFDCHACGVTIIDSAVRYAMADGFNLRLQEGEPTGPEDSDDGDDTTH